MNYEKTSVKYVSSKIFQNFIFHFNCFKHASIKKKYFDVGVKLIHYSKEHAYSDTKKTWTLSKSCSIVIKLFSSATLFCR